MLNVPRPEDTRLPEDAESTEATGRAEHPAGSAGAPARSTTVARGRPLLAGITTAAVGFAGSFALVLTGLRAVGADRRGAMSGLLLLCLAMCALSLWLGLRHRQPLSVAWSTPGAAVLIGAGHVAGGYRAAVGAFVVAGLLVMATGLWDWLGRRIAAVPVPIAMALLAGILFPLCRAPVLASVAFPARVLPIVGAWALLFRYARACAVPGALLVAVGGVLLRHDAPLGSWHDLLARPEFTAPAFRPETLVGLAVPLYVITMAAQNLPGLAVLTHFGYRPPARELLVTTGASTVLIACGGGFMLNMAASTAALVAGPEAGEDRERRWIGAVTAAAVYGVFGLAAGLFAVLLGATSPLVFQAVAGLALLDTLASALTKALTGAPGGVPAAAVTFVVAASGVTALHLTSAFWGLLAGLAVHGLMKSRAPEPR
ncbi:benzoate/H(+) symporter BenE family transporter [Streptomyces beihaiensis]|uniref:Benzoate/H(+) symporter BenE family transporter n=1 Tax=Streptomyces beihaiensis TaxID=2984495 RepID=A0ABT3TW08_9ACTN|nr:benzoate/H(+) symporter BenE family transporter [Streptomyces beihaiensis]MCX3060975.1 benzoate/H(+) symporter BenE family transporter [Streptomyces beihaiensis]